MSSDLDEQLATLAREQGRLETLLSIDENWRALAQLDAREARGEALVSVDGAVLRARLLDSLKYNRLYQARTKILEAIAILTETAALPTFAIPPSTRPEVEAQTPEAVEPEPAETGPQPERTPAPAPHAAEPLELPAAETQDAPLKPAAVTANPKQEHVPPPPEPEPEPPSAEIQAEPAYVEPPPPQSDPHRTPLRATIHTAPPVSLETHHPAADPTLATELLQIRGITPALAARLQSLGVGHAGDIAVWTKDDVNSFSSALGLGRAISRQNWIEQAALIVQRSGRKLPARQPVHQPTVPPVPPAAAKLVLPEPLPSESLTAEPLIPKLITAVPVPAEPTPEKPTPTAVATIVAGAARSIAERIERLRESEDAAPSEPDDRPAKPIVERARDSTAAAPARHTPADYVSILSREAPEPATEPKPAPEEEHRPAANVEPNPLLQPEATRAAIETATAPVDVPQVPATPQPAVATVPLLAEREPPPEPEAAPAEPEPPAAPAAAASLPADIENRLNRLERDTELTSADEIDIAATAPIPVPPALNGNTVEHSATHFPGHTPPAASDVGTIAGASAVPPAEPEPHPEIGEEAEIEFTRRREPGFAAAGAHSGSAPPLPSSTWTGDPDPPQRFDKNDYDAYRGQSEEASVEIVRGDSAARTRLPGKPRSNNQQSQETTAAVRRFLDALRGR